MASPTEPLLNDAARALAAKDYKKAHAACLEALKLDPRAARAFYLLAVLTAEHDNHAKACELFDRAIASAPNTGVYHADKARSLIALFRRAEALQEVETAAACDDLSARTLDTIGVVYSRAGLHDRSVPFYERACELSPDNASYWYNLAAGLQFLGKFDDATSAYRRVIDIDPSHVKAWSALTLMNRQSADQNDIRTLEPLFDSRTSADDRLHIGHAVAKSYEDLSQPAPAMRWLARAKAAKRDSVDYDPAATRALFAAAEATATPTSAAANAPSDEAPIFVVGLPRTGTTLVDRIISSHSSVTSAGELSDFALELKLATQTPSPYVLDEETLVAADAADLGKAGAGYIQRARRTVGDAPRFLDKMPLNFFYSALILRALPNARVICLRRHPLDSVLSNYRQLFATGYSYYNYAYDLGWAADYYARFDRLISHFASVLPAGRFTQVAYENIVANLEGEARRLVSFCDLDWEDQCLSFHKNTAPVATASSSQVRQPLYSSSVARWVRYRDFLGPAIDVFREQGIAIEPADA